MSDLLMGIATICFFAAIVGIIKPYIKNWRRKHFAFSALGFFILMMIVVPTDPNQQKAVADLANDSSKDKSAEKTNEKKAVVAPDQKYLEQLQREIASLKKEPGLRDVPSTKEGVLIGVVLIGARAKLLEDAPQNLRAETKAAQAEYVRLIKAYQRDAFPKLRMAQGKVWKEALWENDIDVAILGPSNSTLRLTAGMFAANRNIKATHEAAAETLRSLRFRKNSFEWYRGADGYQYSMNGPADDVVASFSESGQWVPLDT
jgi:hypothetical protein